MTQAKIRSAMVAVVMLSLTAALAGPQAVSAQQSTSQVQVQAQAPVPAQAPAPTPAQPIEVQTQGPAATPAPVAEEKGPNSGRVSSDGR